MSFSDRMIALRREANLTQQAFTEMTGSNPVPTSHSLIGSQIHLLRDQRVMIDSDLAELYGTQTKVLVQAVKRNLARFPSDFMFQLNPEEFNSLRSQFVTSKN
jgi:ORF6N domain